MYFQNSKKFGLYLLLLVFFTLACQEEDIPNEIDEDMAIATASVDDYLQQMVGYNDTGSTSRVLKDSIDDINHSITVLKFNRGKLVYNTNTDDLSGYNEVGEMTVTAYVNPGEYIFWFAGDGIYLLDDIDFDYRAVKFLGDLPEYLLKYKMWVVKVPNDYDPNHDVLKYDIVYETRENAGVKVRLDPKIQIKNIVDIEISMED